MIPHGSSPNPLIPAILRGNPILAALFPRLCLLWCHSLLEIANFPRSCFHSTHSSGYRIFCKLPAPITEEFSAIGIVVRKIMFWARPSRASCGGSCRQPRTQSSSPNKIYQLKPMIPFLFSPDGGGWKLDFVKGCNLTPWSLTGKLPRLFGLKAGSSGFCPVGSFSCCP